MTKLAIIYYSATGHGTTMANRVAAAAKSAGAEVRVRHVAETHDPSIPSSPEPLVGEVVADRFVIEGVAGRGGIEVCQIHDAAWLHQQIGVIELYHR